MNAENSNTSDPQKLLLNLFDKISWSALSNLSMEKYYTWKKTIPGKSNAKIINLKYQLQHGMKNLNYLMDPIL